MRLYTAKLENSQTTIPEWITWFPVGQASLEDGPEYFVTEESWNLVRSNIERRGIELVVDYEHQTMNGGQAPAAGWCKEWRFIHDVGIQARVEWTEKARSYLESNEYRYFSPVFELAKSKDGKLILSRVHNVALTNDPRTNNIKAIIAKLQTGQVTMEFLRQLASLLGLSETATEEEVSAEVEKLRQKASELAGVLGLPPEAGYEEIVNAVKELSGSSEMASKEVVPAKLLSAIGLHEKAGIELVMAKIKTMQTDTTEATDLKERIQRLEEQIAKGNSRELLAKYAAKFSPAMLAEKGDSGNPLWATLAKNDPKGFEQIAKTLPDVVPAPLPTLKDSPVKTILTAEDKKYCAKFGLDEKDYLKTKQENIYG